jgi:hypothetical protein
MNISRKTNLFFYIVITIGLILRVIWPADMEWKDDEKIMYAAAREAFDNGTLPAAGMRSGGGIVNPGMSVGAFALIAAFTNDPVAMNQVVQVLNVIGVLCFLLFVFLKVEKREKEIWLAGIALAAISPLAVIFSRKIWAQDILPIISFLVILTNAYRGKGWCAFLWGLSGALIGQIHMSGFFFAGGLFIFTLVHDHVNKIKFRWGYWIAGSFLGSLTLIPWILFMLHNPQITRQSFMNIFQFNFFIYWFIDSQGLNVYYSLRRDFWQYLKEPILFGVPTYLAAVAQLFLVATAVYTITKIFNLSKKVFQRIKQRTFLVEIFTNISLTRFYLLSILLGLGVLMTLSGSTINPHYLICAFPFQYIFLAKVLEKNRILFRSVIIAQMIITITFLVFIHTNKGAPNGDYKKTYSSQTDIERQLKPE